MKGRTNLKVQIKKAKEAEDKFEKPFRDYSEEYFYSLCQKQKRKRRHCLRCQSIFISNNAGNRICSNCSSINAKVVNREIHPLSSSRRGAAWKIADS